MPLSKDSEQYRKLYDRVSHWLGIMEVITRQAGVSVADELAKLQELRHEGVLSEDEWTRAKELYLGKPEDKRGRSVHALRALHELYQTGALSESEFNMKKWDILSRKDL